MVKYSLDNLYGSMADATRRDMLQRLLSSELTVSRLAETYNMSLPAVSKHLKVLEASGLIVKEKRGRQYHVRLTSAALKEAAEYLQQYQAVLHNRLDSFGAYFRKPTVSEQEAFVPTSGKEQEIVVTNLLDADIETTWKAYTDPAAIKEWWGIPGAQLKKVENDVRVGGIWRFTVHGVKDRDFVISGKYSVVEYPNRLEYTDGAGDPVEPRPEAQVTVTFEKLPSGKTLLTKKSVATPAVHQLNAAWLQAIGGS